MVRAREGVLISSSQALSGYVISPADTGRAMNESRDPVTRRPPVLRLLAAALAGALGAFGAAAGAHRVTTPSSSAQPAATAAESPRD